jgi:hypothetical protein
MNIQAASPSTFAPRRRFRYGAVLPCMVLFAASLYGSKPFAQTPPPAASHTTFVFFADHRLREEQWNSLFAALHRGKTVLATSTPALSGEVDMMRSDQLQPSMRVDSAIIVYLHGDCTLLPRPRFVVMGALGWVPRVKGRIQPFIHVDCARIVDMLGPQALGMNHDRRDTVMAEAVAHVILHEWIHYSTQSAAHSGHGVSKSVFGVADLLADDAPQNPHRRSIFRNRGSL